MSEKSSPSPFLQKIRDLVEKTKSNFKWASRFDYRTLDFEQIKEHVWKKGLPLVISNTTLAWKRDRELFGFEWLKKNLGTNPLSPYDVETFEDSPNWTIGEFLSYLSLSREQRKRKLYSEMLCPDPWREFLKSKLKEFFCNGSSDLMGELSAELQVDTLRIWLGTEESFSGSHLEGGGAILNNLMIYADEGAYSLWFCVSTEDREKALAFWKTKSKSTLFGPKNPWVSIEDLSQAPFTIFLIEQREGDFVLIPPDSIHQMLNKDGKSVKISWNTISCNNIEISYYRSREFFQRFGKPELFRIKTLAYYGLINRTMAITSNPSKVSTDILAEEFPPLLSIVEHMIESEWITLSEDESEGDLEVLRFTDNHPHQRLCNFCKCDIWNRCFHCSKCSKLGTDISQEYDICLSCVAKGRSCLHKEELTLMEYISMKQIKEQFEKAKEAYQKVLRSVRRKKNKKKFTEWKSKSNNISKPELSEASIAYRLVKLYSKQNDNVCHHCQKTQTHAAALTVACTNSSCDKYYCIKCLWNRYGCKLSNCFLVKNWTCPFCNNTCNCVPCLENRGINPAQFSCESLLSNILALPFPFSAYESPNVPAISDFKPVYYSHALKKRKNYVSVNDSTSPTPHSPSKSLKKITSFESVPNELSNSSSTPEFPSSSSPRFSKNFSPPEDFQNILSSNHSSPNENSLDSSIKQEEKDSSKDRYDKEMDYDYEDGHHDENFRDSYGHHEVDHKTTLLVRNLSYACTCDDLGNFFSPCGEIDQITIPLDRTTNKLRGYGFVKFKKREDAERAMEKLNRIFLKDRIIELEWSIDKAARKALDRNSICYKCGKKGHFARNCSVPEPLSRSKNSDSRESRERETPPASLSSSSSISTILPQGSSLLPIMNNPPISGNNNVELTQPMNFGSQTPAVIPFSQPSPVSLNSPTLSYSGSDLNNRKEPRIYICFKCGKEGHVAQNCPEREDIGPGFKGVICFKCGQGGHLANKCNKCDKKSRACFICGKDGHLAADCPDRDHLRDRTFPSSNLNVNSNPSNSNDFSSPHHQEEIMLEPSSKYRKVNPSPGDIHSPRISSKLGVPVWNNDYRSEWTNNANNVTNNTNGVNELNSSSSRDFNGVGRERKSGWEKMYGNHHLSRDIRDPRDLRDSREMRDLRDHRDQRDPRNLRDHRDQREPRDSRDMRDHRDPRLFPPPMQDSRSSHSNNLPPPTGLDQRQHYYPSTFPPNNRDHHSVYDDGSNNNRNGMTSRVGPSPVPNSGINILPEPRPPIFNPPPDNPLQFILNTAAAIPYPISTDTNFFPNDVRNSSSTFFPPQPSTYVETNKAPSTTNSTLLQNGSVSNNNNSTSSSSSSSSTSNDKEKNEKRRAFKSFVTPIVIQRLSRHFNNGLIKSKDHFKQLSRKIIHSTLEKEHPHYNIQNSNIEHQLKIVVEDYFQTYTTRLKQNPNSLNEWLNKSSNTQS